MDSTKIEKDTSRIEAFSDGIFAVAITLLSLDIGVDLKVIEAHHPLQATTDGELLGLLLGLFPQIITYFYSFVIVLLMWMSHHRIFKLIRDTNFKLIMRNGLLLLIIALVPFPARTLGDFHGTAAEKMSIMFYTGYTVIIAMAFVLLMGAVRDKKVDIIMPHITKAAIDSLYKELLTGLFCNMSIFLISFFSPSTSMILSFLMLLFWAKLSTKRNPQTE